MAVLVGIHPVREALRARSRSFQYLAVSRDRRDARINELVRLAREQGIGVRFESPAALDHLAGSPRHQGAVGVVAAKPLLALEDLFAAPAGSPSPGLLIALDGIEDPHNLGAILRSAAAAGAGGAVIPARRAAPLNETVARASAGGLEHVPVAQAPNLAAALEKAKAAGYWIVGLEAASPQPIWRHDFTLPTLLVVGGEGRGLHELIRKRCDFLVSIPLATGVASLNASAAAAIALFEVVRQRQSIGGLPARQKT